MDWDNRGNGQEAWNGALEEGAVWDEHQGPARTAAFGAALLGWFPDWLNIWLADGSRRILDWGCATGEIAGMLAARFPNAFVVGTDFAWSGVIRARRSFPNVAFFNRSHVEGTYDAIVVSNCHEHFVDYKALMRDHLAHTTGFYIILVPFEENLGDGESMTVAQREAAGHAHVHRFSRESFPNEFEGWTKLEEGIVVPGPLWPGEQLAMVYGKVL